MPLLNNLANMSASEAVYAFAGWLTTREEPTVLSAGHDAAPVAELIRQFCEANNLTPPRAGWEGTAL